MMGSALNGSLLQHYIIKKLLNTLNAYHSYSVMKINTSEMGIEFPIAIQRIGKLYKHNIYTAQRLASKPTY